MADPKFNKVMPNSYSENVKGLVSMFNAMETGFERAFASEYTALLLRLGPDIQLFPSVPRETTNVGKNYRRS